MQVYFSLHEITWILLIHCGKINNAERKPVAQSNSALSVSNFEKTAKVSAALGVNPKHAEAVLRSVRSMPFLSETAKGALLDSTLRAGQYQLSLLRKPNAIGDVKLRLFNRELMSDGGGLKLIFPEYDIFFRYRKSREVESLIEDPGISQPISFKESNAYKSNGTLEVGARFPHIWLSGDEMGSRIVSSLSLPALRRHSKDTAIFTIVANYIDQASWTKICGSHKMFDLCFIKDAPTNEKYIHSYFQNVLQNPPHYNCLSSSKLSVNQSFSNLSDEHILSSGAEILGKSDTVVLFDITGEWAALLARSLNNANNRVAVAIRPDGHIAGILEESPDNRNCGSFSLKLIKNRNLEDNKQIFLQNLRSSFNIERY